VEKDDELRGGIPGWACALEELVGRELEQVSPCCILLFSFSLFSFSLFPNSILNSTLNSNLVAHHL
jgi:hypothetical protein